MDLTRSPHRNASTAMNVDLEVIKIVSTVLNLGPSGRRLDRDTALLGSIAELDSMAVVSMLTTLEERFGFAVEDDEVDGRTFATVGSLIQFVEDKLSQ
jgi:acyl carrier protein